MKFIGGSLAVCLVCILSVNSVSIQRDQRDKKIANWYTTEEWTTPERETTEDWRTTERETTEEWRTTERRTTEYWPTTEPRTTEVFSNKTTTDHHKTTHHPHPPTNATCYGHFIYKEEHNIIVDGEDDRHKNPDECEFACTVRFSKDLRHIKIHL